MSTTTKPAPKKLTKKQMLELAAKRSEAAKKANATRGPEARSAAARKAQESRTPAERSAAAKKAAATLQARKAAASKKRTRKSA